MKYSVLGGLVLSAVALLSGCLGPSLPEAKDVADGLRESWAPCTMLRPVGIKKTNGIDRGDFYQMEVEYRLEFVKDVAKEDIWGQEFPELIPRDFPSTKEYFAAMEPQYKANKRKEQFWEMNCPEPAFRNFWQFSTLPQFKTVYGKDVKSGDGFDVQVIFHLVKTEKGWMVGR